MSSIILRSATRYLVPIILLFSIFLLLRGHDEPGGGFSGGLLGATALALYAIAFDVETSRRLVRVELRLVLGAGLLLATGSGTLGVVGGDPFLTSRWATVHVGALGPVKLGTPFVFDVGVYLVVVAVTLMIVYALAEEE